MKIVLINGVNHKGSTYHIARAMKSFLDHYGYMWMAHRPEDVMFKKQALCVATAAGAGMKSTIKDMADSLFFWGVAKTYKIGFHLLERNGWNKADVDYWHEKGWCGNKRPWNN